MKKFDNQNDSVHSIKIDAGWKRSYFIDVKKTRGNDHYLVLTENSKKDHGTERHKIYIYKEDINKFVTALNEATEEIKKLMPEFNFDKFNRREEIDESHFEKEEDVSW